MPTRGPAFHGINHFILLFKKGTFGVHSSAGRKKGSRRGNREQRSTTVAKDGVECKTGGKSTGSRGQKRWLFKTKTASFATALRFTLRGAKKGEKEKRKKKGGAGLWGAKKKGTIHSKGGTHGGKKSLLLDVKERGGGGGGGPRLKRTSLKKKEREGKGNGS